MQGEYFLYFSDILITMQSSGGNIIMLPCKANIFLLFSDVLRTMLCCGYSILSYDYIFFPLKIQNKDQNVIIFYFYTILFFN